MSTTGSSIGDTGEPQEATQSGQINSASWSGTAPSSGIVNFDTIGSDFDTYLSNRKGHLCHFLSPQFFYQEKGSSIMATDFRSDRVIVKLNQTASSTAITNLQAQIGVTKVTTASQFGIQIWEIPSGKVEETISAYENDPRFQYMEPDYIITLDDVEKTSPTQEDLATITPQTTTPNDPGYPQLWGLNNTGQSRGTPDADIDAPEAWDIQTGNPNTVIGVIDSGVDYTHPDLVGNIWTNPGETAGNGIDDDGNGYIDDVRGWDFAYNDNDPSDVDGHGTHVAGTIASKGSNSVGVTGVAWNAKIMPLRFLDDSGSGSTSNAILAINYATAKGVKLTNNSWGGGGYSQALYDAINTAGQQGALFIAAAGNSSLNNDLTPAYPASYNLPNIISVASTTRTDALSSFSNYGASKVHLGAPGSEIYSTTPGGNYDTYSGTSMASPHVTGAAALVWSQNPTWTAQQVKNRLLQTTDSTSALRGKTISGGRLNINSALRNSTSNDNFANRIVLSGVPVSTSGSNVGATGEVGEPSQSGATNSVWWSWRAPSSGNYTFDTIGSNFDTWLSVYTGSAVNNLTRIGFDDDGGGNRTSKLTRSVIAGTTYHMAVDGFGSKTGQIQLRIAPTSTPAAPAKLTETANADTINGVPDPIAGKPANNTLKEETGTDPLTGGPGADTLMLPFTESFVSTRVPVTDFASSEKTDILTEGGATINAPSLFSPVANNAVPTLVKDVSPVLTEANGALAGNPPLGINSAPFGVANTSPFADPNLVGVYEAKPSGISVA